MTEWREIAVEWKPFLRVIDLSGLTLELLPQGATFGGLVWLEMAVLPTGLRVLPGNLFRMCWRLWSIDTSRTALETIEGGACDECRSLAAFVFPPTLREIAWSRFGRESEAFSDTAITSMDLSGTMAEKVVVCEMIFLVELVLSHTKEGSIVNWDRRDLGPRHPEPLTGGRFGVPDGPS
jgi:hypothetical protein